MRFRPEVLRTIAGHPVESVYRLAGQLEGRDVERQKREAVGAYSPDPEWLGALHRELEVESCAEEAAFRRAWEEVARVPGGLEPNSQDGGATLARALWCVIRHTGATRAAEVGVARGVSSAMTLAALDGTGHLWSVDLPLLSDRWRDRARTAVPARHRGDWTYVRGPSQRRLRPLLAEVGPVDVFLADSLGTIKTATFDFEAGWAGLRPGGFLVAGSVDRSVAFARFVERHSPPFWLTARFEDKDGVFGVARRQS
jgi:hypothetical protein